MKRLWVVVSVSLVLGIAGVIFMVRAGTLFSYPGILGYLDGLETYEEVISSPYYSELLRDEEFRGFFRELSEALSLWRAGLILILLGVFSGLGSLVASAAERKGRSYWAFYFLSILLSPLLTGIFVALMGRSSLSETAHPSTGSKKCPMCAEEIKFEALVCRYCGHGFEQTVIMGKKG